MSSSISVRLIQSADVDACATIMAATPLWQQYGVTQVSATARFRQGVDTGATIYVAIKADEGITPLGFIWAVSRGAFDRSGYIPLLAVLASERGTGIGRLLLESAENYLAQTASDVFLLCSGFNYDAQRFYERQGYIQVGSLPDYIQPGTAELIYRKRLHKPA